VKRNESSRDNGMLEMGKPQEKGTSWGIMKKNTEKKGAGIKEKENRQNMKILMHRDLTMETGKVEKENKKLSRIGERRIWERETSEGIIEIVFQNKMR
jgi:hypothetical protein